MDGLKPSQVQPSCYVFLETKEVKASEQFIGFWIQVQIFEDFWGKFPLSLRESG